MFAASICSMGHLFSISNPIYRASRPKSYDVGGSLRLRHDRGNHINLHLQRTFYLGNTSQLNQSTLEMVMVIAAPSTTPRRSLPWFTTTKCTGIGGFPVLNTADPVQSGFTV